VSSEPTDSPVSRLVDALDVRRNAKLGVLASVLLTVAAYGFFVLIPNQGGAISGYRPTARPLYLVLAFVVLVSTAMLVTVALTVRNVVRMTMSPPKWIRRGGTAAVVGGVTLAVLAALGPLAGVVGLTPAYGQLLLLTCLLLVYGVWAVHAAHRRRYGYHGAAGAFLAAAGFVAVGWVALVDPSGFLGEGLERVDRSLFLGANLLALGGVSLLGSGVLRVGAVPAPASLGLLFTLPVGLAGLTAVTYAQAPALVFLPFGVTLGVAWTAVGFELRRGRGVPPAESFDPGIDLDPSG
jgi:hypothetical protein